MSLVEHSVSDHIAIVSLNRPDALNAISGAMADELTDVFRAISANDDVWVVILSASGEKAFCVGADLKERAGFDLDDYHRNRKQIRGLFTALREIPQPTIAAVFGFALGGGFELALSCDFIVAAEDAQLGLPEARVGLLPAGGGTQLLARRLGPARAKEMIFTADRMSAEEAMEIGLLSDIVTRDGLDEGARWLAEEICKQSPVAVRAAKSAIDHGLGRPIDDGIEVEHKAWEVVIASEDRGEGISAFNEKRTPSWKNR